MSRQKQKHTLSCEDGAQAPAASAASAPGTGIASFFFRGLVPQQHAKSQQASMHEMESRLKDLVQAHAELVGVLCDSQLQAELSLSSPKTATTAPELSAAQAAMQSARDECHALDRQMYECIAQLSFPSSDPSSFLPQLQPVLLKLCESLSSIPRRHWMRSTETSLLQQLIRFSTRVNQHALTSAFDVSSVSTPSMHASSFIPHCFQCYLSLPIFGSLLQFVLETLALSPVANKRKRKFAVDALIFLLIECMQLDSSTASSSSTELSAPTLSSHLCQLLVDLLSRKHVLYLQQHILHSLQFHAQSTNTSTTPRSQLPLLHSRLIICFTYTALSDFFPHNSGSFMRWSSCFRMQEAPVARADSRSQLEALASTSESRTHPLLDALGIIRLAIDLANQDEDAIPQSYFNAAPINNSESLAFMGLPSNTDFHDLVSSSSSTSTLLSDLRSRLITFAMQLFDPQQVGAWMNEATANNIKIPVGAIAAFLAPLYQLFSQLFFQVASSDEENAHPFIQTLLPELLRACVPNSSGENSLVSPSDATGDARAQRLKKNAPTLMLAHPNSHSEALTCCFSVAKKLLKNFGNVRSVFFDDIKQYQQQTLRSIALEAHTLMRIIVERSVANLRNQKINPLSTSTIPPCLILPDSVSPNSCEAMPQSIYDDSISSLEEFSRSLLRMNARYIDVHMAGVEYPTWLSLPTVTFLIRSLHAYVTLKTASSEFVERSPHLFSICLQLLSAMLPSLSNAYKLPANEFKDSQSGVPNRPLPVFVAVKPFWPFIDGDDEDAEAGAGKQRDSEEPQQLSSTAASSSAASSAPSGAPTADSQQPKAPFLAEADSSPLPLHFHAMPWFKLFEVSCHKKTLQNTFIQLSSEAKYNAAFLSEMKREVLQLLLLLLKSGSDVSDGKSGKQFSEVLQLILGSEELSIGDVSSHDSRALLALLFASLLWRELQGVVDVSCAIAYLDILCELVPTRSAEEPHSLRLTPQQSRTLFDTLESELDAPLISLQTLLELSPNVPTSLLVCILLQRALVTWPFDQPILLQKWHQFLLTRLPLLPVESSSTATSVVVVGGAELEQRETERPEDDRATLDGSAMEFCSAVIETALHSISVALEQYLLTHSSKKNQKFAGVVPGLRASPSQKSLVPHGDDDVGEGDHPSMEEEEDEDHEEEDDADKSGLVSEDSQFDADDSDGANEEDDNFHPNAREARLADPRRIFDEAITVPMSALKLHIGFLSAQVHSQSRHTRIMHHKLETVLQRLEANERRAAADARANQMAAESNAKQSTIDASRAEREQEWRMKVSRGAVSKERQEKLAVLLRDALEVESDAAKAAQPAAASSHLHISMETVPMDIDDALASPVPSYSTSSQAPASVQISGQDIAAGLNQHSTLQSSLSFGELCYRNHQVFSCIAQLIFDITRANDNPSWVAFEALLPNVHRPSKRTRLENPPTNNAATATPGSGYSSASSHAAANGASPYPTVASLGATHAPHLRAAKEVLSSLQRVLDSIFNAIAREIQCIQLAWRIHQLQTSIAEFSTAVFFGSIQAIHHDLPLLIVLHQQYPEETMDRYAKLISTVDSALPAMRRMITSAAASASSINHSPDTGVSSLSASSPSSSSSSYPPPFATPRRLDEMQLCVREMELMIQPQLGAVSERIAQTAQSRKRRQLPLDADDDDANLDDDAEEQPEANDQAADGKSAKLKSQPVNKKRATSAAASALRIRSRNKYVDRVAHEDGEYGAYLDLEDFIEDDLDDQDDRSEQDLNEA